MEFQHLQVGQVRSEWRGLADGYIMDYNNVSGLTLFLFFKKPTPQEEQQIKAESVFKIAFTDYKGVGFFAVKFGNLPWGDCAFSPNLYKTPPVFDVIEDGKGYALNVIFVDTATGTVKGLRQIGLGTNFSRLFRNWCMESLKQQMTRNYYDRIVNECYRRYETEQLMRLAKFQYEINTHREDTERESQ